MEWFPVNNYPAVLWWWMQCRGFHFCFTHCKKGSAIPVNVYRSRRCISLFTWVAVSIDCRRGSKRFAQKLVNGQQEPDSSKGLWGMVFSAVTPGSRPVCAFAFCCFVSTRGCFSHKFIAKHFECCVHFTSSFCHLQHNGIGSFSVQVIWTIPCHPVEVAEAHGCWDETTYAQYRLASSRASSVVHGLPHNKCWGQLLLSPLKLLRFMQAEPAIAKTLEENGRYIDLMGITLRLCEGIILQNMKVHFIVM